MHKESYIPQVQLSRLNSVVAPGNVSIIYGPRRVGNTTLVQRYVQQYDPDVLVVTGEDISVRDFLVSDLFRRDSPTGLFVETSGEI